MVNTVQYNYTIIDNYSAKLRKIAKITDKFKTSVRASDKSVKKYSKTLSRQAKVFRNFNKFSNESNRSLRRLIRTTPNATREIGRLVGAGRKIRGVTESFRKLNKQMSITRRSAQAASMKMAGLAQRRPGGRAVMTPAMQVGRGGARARTGGVGVGVGVQGIGTAVAAYAGAALLKKTIGQSVAIEDAMQDIARVTDFDPKGLKKLAATLEDISEYLGQSKLALAKIAYEGGKLEVSAERMPSFVKFVAMTGIAFDLLNETAGQMVGSIMVRLNLDEAGIKKYLDSVNLIADTTIAAGAQVIAVTERVSGMFSLFGAGPKEAAAIAGFAAQAEPRQERAASGLLMIFRRMAEKPGMRARLSEDLSGTLGKELEYLGALSPDRLAAEIKKDYGDEAGRLLLKLIANRALFEKTMKIAFSDKAVGSMGRELENKLERSSMAFSNLGTTFTNTMEALGEANKPLAVAMADMFTTTIDGIGEWAKLSPGVVQFGTAIGGVAIAVVGLTAVATLLKLVLVPLFASFLTMLPLLAGIAAVGTAAYLLYKGFTGSSGVLKDLPRHDRLMSGLATAATSATAAPGLGAFMENAAAIATPRLDSFMTEDPSDILPATNNGLGLENELTAARRNRVDVSGKVKIQVSADKGSKIDSIEIDLDGGANLEAAMF